MMKIPDTAIIGMWWSWNYGAFLTSLALYKTVEKLGAVPVLLDHSNMSETWESFSSTPSPFRDFTKEQKLLTKIVDTPKRASKLNEFFQNFITGSDQLWRHQYTHEFGTQFFLDFVHCGNRKIAYATSLGNIGAEVPDNFRRTAARLLEHFDAISVREYSGVDELARLYQAKSIQTIDPVFLPDRLFWQALAAKDSAPAPNYTLSYILDANSQVEKLQHYIQQSVGLTQVLITDYEKPVCPSAAPQYDIILNQISLQKWLSAIANCNFMMTDSFHGACFAIIFNIPFVCIINEKRGATRFHSLQQLFPALAHRFIMNPDDIPAAVTIQDFSETNSILQHERERCLAWLKDALQCTPKQHAHIEGIPPCKKPGMLRMMLYKMKKNIINRIKSINNSQRTNQEGV